jgi:hypothetical protein
MLLATQTSINRGASSIERSVVWELLVGHAMNDELNIVRYRATLLMPSLFK